MNALNLLDGISGYDDKVLLSKMRIQQWYEHWNGKVFVAFSGGKDSTVLLHLVRSLYPDVKAVFSNTGLEYPELVAFVKTFDNVDIVRPAKSFVRVLREDGYPLGGKQLAKRVSALNNAKENNFKTRRLALTGYTTRTQKINLRNKVSKKWMPFVGSDINLTDKCCDYLKKNPTKIWLKDNQDFRPFVGMMMGEGQSRDSSMRSRQCNEYSSKTPTSVPMKFWTEEDVYRYVDENNIEVASVYKDYNLKRTGCTFCAYGAEFEKGENRFEKLKKSHPVQFNAFIHKNGMNKALDYAGIRYGEEPAYTKPETKTFKCALCENTYSLNEIGSIQERKWTDDEKDNPSPLSGMIVYCENCCKQYGAKW